MHTARGWVAAGAGAGSRLDASVSVPRPFIRPCVDDDIGAIAGIVNDAARAYSGVIPADRYHQPYVPLDEVRGEIGAGVRFWGLYEGAGEGTGQALAT